MIGQRNVKLEIDNRKSTITDYSKPINYVSINGNTLLHNAIRDDLTIKKFNRLLNSLGLKVASSMARTRNNHGKLPIKLARKSGLSLEIKEALCMRLHDLMLAYETNTLSHPVDISHIVNKYYSQDNITLNYHLSVACMVANIAREIIKESCTHTQTNHYLMNKRDELRYRIDKMRDDHENMNGDNPSNDTELINIIKLIYERGIGNCYEFSFLALHESLKLDPNITAELFELDNGDHIFLVIGRHPNSDINDYKTWGDDTVICDAWSGNIYPLYKLEKKLKDCWLLSKKDGSWFNVLLNFNPSFYRITCSLILSPEEKKSYINNLQLFGMFAEKKSFKNSVESIDKKQLSY